MARKNGSGGRKGKPARGEQQPLFKGTTPAKPPTIPPRSAPVAKPPIIANPPTTPPVSPALLERVEKAPRVDPRGDAARYFVETYLPSTDLSDPMRDRVRGAFIWSVYGDTAGMPFEGQAPFAIFKKNGGWVTELVTPSNGFSAYLKKGGWTDDSQLKIAHLQSYIDCDGQLDMDDVAYHHVRMLDAGPRGWGGSTRESTLRLKRGLSWRQSGAVGGGGNGIPMKVGVVGLRYGVLYSAEIKAGTFKYADLVRDVRNIAVMTHRDSRAVISGIVHAILVAWAINDVDPIENWDRLMKIVIRLEEHFPKEAETLSERLVHIPTILPRGPEYFAHFFRVGCFVLESYPFSLATYLYYRKNVVDAVFAAVNAGGDCDSTAAMTAELCGAEAGLGKEDRTLALEAHDLLLGIIDAFYDTLRSSQR